MPTGHDQQRRRPTEILQAMLEGREPLSSNPAIGNWALLAIHQGAVEILTLPTHERRAALDKVPASLRGVMGEEVRRLWRMRRNNP